MKTKCPRCEFENPHSELTPLSECPKCGVIYSKAKPSLEPSKYKNLLKINTNNIHTTEKIRQDTPQNLGLLARIWNNIRSFCFEGTDSSAPKDEKENEQHQARESWKRRDSINQIYTKKAPEIRDSIYRKGYGSILKKFVNKYSSNYSVSDLSKLHLFLTSKGVNLNIENSTEDCHISKQDTESSFSLLIKILAIEEIEKEKIEEELLYDQFKKNIVGNKPKNLYAFIKEYAFQFDQSGTHADYLRLFRLLNEKGISHTDDQVQELLYKAREEVEIMAFEENLSNPEPNLLIDEIDIMSGEAFESCLSDLYEKMGYIVESTPVTGDQGADLIITKHGIRSVVQAKRYSSAVGNSAVQQAIAALSYYQGNKAVVVTNNYFTQSAVKLAKSANVELMDRDKLHSLIEQFY
jgi:predicted  nucleic acid-binding Zn-ribbon protein